MNEQTEARVRFVKRPAAWRLKVGQFLIRLGMRVIGMQTKPAPDWMQKL